MSSRQTEDDHDVTRLLGLLDLATVPESFNHVDDDMLALLAGSRASAEELAMVRARPGRLPCLPPSRR